MNVSDMNHSVKIDLLLLLWIMFVKLVQMKQHGPYWPIFKKTTRKNQDMNRKCLISLPLCHQFWNNLSAAFA